MKTIADLIARQPPKQKCSDKGCPSMTYWNGLAYLCVVCDMEMFEECPDCCNLNGWCTCDGARAELPEPVGVEPSTRHLILELLALKGTMKSREIIKAVDRTEAAVVCALRDLAASGALSKPRRGWYEVNKRRGKEG